MRIVTNPGSNLSAPLLQRYDIDLTPQRIVVDGTEFDTREGIALTQVDAWVKSAREHPYVLGTSAAEFARFFAEVAKADPEIVAVMTSRKVIQSYDAACTAARTVGERGKTPIDVRIVDTTVTDAGAGLVTLLAALAREDGQALDQVQVLCDAFRHELRMQLWIATLDNLIKGGRASFLRGFLANLFRVRPVLHFSDGELQVAGKVSAKTDPVEYVAQTLAAQYHGRRVWAAVLHGNAPELGERLADQLQDRLDVDFLYLQPFSSSIYLHVGPGAVGAFIAPIDRLPWVPPRPDF